MINNIVAIRIKNRLLEAGVLKCSGTAALMLIEEAMQCKKPFTVIGYYRDNMQPYAGQLLAADAKEAAELAVSIAESQDAGQLRVLSVIAGAHDDLHVES